MMRSDLMIAVTLYALGLVANAEGIHAGEAIQIECYLRSSKIVQNMGTSVVVEIKNETKQDVTIKNVMVGEFMDEQEANKEYKDNKQKLDKRFGMTSEAGESMLHLRLKTATHSQTRGRLPIRIPYGDPILVKKFESKFIKAEIQGDFLNDEVIGLQIELRSGEKVLAATEVKEFTIIQQDRKKEDDVPVKSDTPATPDKKPE